MCHRTKKISAKLAKRFWRYRNFYRATAMLSAVYTVVVCLFVCLYVCVCVCLSHSGIVSKRLNVGSRKQCHTIAIFCSCRISTDKCVARFLCHSRATCPNGHLHHLLFLKSLIYLSGSYPQINILCSISTSGRKPGVFYYLHCTML